MLEYRDTQNIEYYSKQLEIFKKPIETEGEYRARLAKAVLDEYDDSLLAMEIALGKNVEEFNNDENILSLQLHSVHGRRKEIRYRKQEDTYFNIAWSELEKILLKNGFDKSYSYNFKDTYDNEREEGYAIWADLKRGILLTAESYSRNNSVNMVRIYHELNVPIQLDEFKKIFLYDLLDGCSYRYVGNKDKKLPALDTLIISRDGRQGLVEYLKKLDSVPFKASNPWLHPKKHFLWLLDYSEARKKDYDFKRINQEKIKKLPERVRDMISFE